MCGIAGILRIHDPKDGAPPHPLQAIPEAWLDVLDDSIKHRGPDGQGRFRDRAIREDGTVVDVAFVHRRLSIIDHEGGRQPMVHDGRRLRPDLTYARGETPRLAHELCPASECQELVAVVFNGCIYNHRELRAELEAQGHVFETDHSDTEVLAHGWRAWNLELQSRLDAMYAALVWDRRHIQITSCADLAGEKPLVRTGASGDGVYCSQPAGALRCALAAEPGWRAFDPLFDELPDWIAHGWSHIPATTELVNPGPRLWQSYPNPDPTPPLPGMRARAFVSAELRLPDREPGSALESSRLDTLIRSSVESRLEADVPLGVFLSGGIDSALIASIAHKTRPDIKAFTVRMPDPGFDESEEAAETASAIGIDHTILDCDPDPASDLVMLIEQLGLPFGDSSLLPTYWVSKAAREHVKVALSGDGGDELFGGYRRHTINPALNHWRRLLRLVPTRLLDQRRPSSRSTYLARLVTAARYGGYDELLSIFPTPDLRRLVPAINGERVGADRFHRVDDPLRYDFTHYLPDDLLRKTDTASMAVGLEVRAPFLAKELVEAALRTPLDVLMPSGQRKGLLKQVARKYLPDHIVDRPKQGFAIPIGEWFRTDFGSMRTLLYDHLESSDPFPGLAEAGVNINMDFVQTMLREHDAAGEKTINPWHGRDHSQRLYMLLVLSIWSKWLQSIR